MHFSASLFVLRDSDDEGARNEVEFIASEINAHVAACYSWACIHRDVLTVPRRHRHRRAPLVPPLHSVSSLVRAWTSLDELSRRPIRSARRDNIDVIVRHFTFPNVTARDTRRTPARRPRVARHVWARVASRANSNSTTSGGYEPRCDGRGTRARSTPPSAGEARNWLIGFLNWHESLTSSSLGRSRRSGLRRPLISLADAPRSAGDARSASGSSETGHRAAQHVPSDRASQNNFACALGR